MSIFDGIMSDIIPLGDALSSALQNTGNAGKASNGQDISDAQTLRSLRLEQAIDNNKLNSPYGPRDFQAGKTQPAQQVNSDVINQQWLQRLNRYSSIPQVEGAQGKKAY